MLRVTSPSLKLPLPQPGLRDCPLMKRPHCKEKHFHAHLSGTYKGFQGVILLQEN